MAFPYKRQVVSSVAKGSTVIYRYRHPTGLSVLRIGMTNLSIRPDLSFTGGFVPAHIFFTWLDGLIFYRASVKRSRSFAGSASSAYQLSRSGEKNTIHSPNLRNSRTSYREAVKKIQFIRRIRVIRAPATAKR